MKGSPFFVLWLAIISYALFYGYVTIERYYRYDTTVFDMGIFDQAIWLIAHGKPIFLSTRGLTIFADHFSPILYLIASLYWIWDSPKTLLILQTAACALGAHPVYLYARKRLENPLPALLFAIAYLLYPALQGLNCFDFHPESIAVPLILYGWWFLASDRFTPSLVCIFFALLCKETVGLVVVPLGIYAFFAIDRKKGGILATVGLTALFVSLETIRLANHGVSSAYISFYGAYGNSYSSIYINLLTHPAKILDALSTGDNFRCIMDLFAPLAFLSFSSPETLAIAAPAMLSNFLSNRHSMHTIYFQYDATVIPFVFLSAIAGFDLFYRMFSDRPYVQGIWRALVILTLIGCVAYGVRNDQAIGNPALFRISNRYYDAAAINDGLSLIPLNASVSAQSAIASHLAHRLQIYMFPNPFQRVCWGNSVTALNQEEGMDLQVKSLDYYKTAIENEKVLYIVLGPFDSSHFPLQGDIFLKLVHIFLSDKHYGAIWANQIIILKRGADYNSGRRLLQHSGFPEYITMQ